MQNCKTLRTSCLLVSAFSSLYPRSRSALPFSLSLSSRPGPTTESGFTAAAAISFEGIHKVLTHHFRDPTHPLPLPPHFQYSLVNFSALPLPPHCGRTLWRRPSFAPAFFRKRASRDPPASVARPLGRSVVYSESSATDGRRGSCSVQGIP